MRLDGLVPARRTTPLRRLLPQLLPRRTGAALLFEHTVRYAPIAELLSAREPGDEPLTLFHVVLAAALRTLVERPRLNRTVLGGRIFDRDTLAITFSVKQGKRDDAELVSTKVEFGSTDTLHDVQRKVDAAIRQSRDPAARSGSRGLVGWLDRLPNPMVRGALGIAAAADRLGLLPPSLAATDPSRTSLFVANLGSIGLDASYHHLSDTGTASIHVTMGKVEPRVLVSEEGTPEVADAFTLRLAIDDRIVDGFYCARSLQRLQHWLAHPRALAEPWPTRTDLVTALLWHRARTAPEEPAYLLRSNSESAWFGTSWSSMLAEVRQVGQALVALGVAPGDRVCIQGSNRPEWTVTYLAAQAIGAVPCGLHEDLSPRDLEAALGIATPAVVVLETEGAAPLIRRADPGIGLVCMARTTERCTSWTALLELGAARDDGEVERRLAAVDPDQPGVAVFTSGTTGEPRLALLSHRSLRWTADRAIEALGVRAGETTVSYLPLSHVAEQNFTIVAAMVAGATVAYAPSRSGVVDTLREVRPTVFFGVPQIWSRIADEIDGELASVGLDRVRLALSGAAGLDAHIFEAFAARGLRLLQTYGQTEGCGPTTLTRPGDARPGTCGPALPGVDLRIEPDGEILFRGPNLFLGYHGDPAAKAEILVDGWLRTGDLGEAVDGHLRILGRKKALLVTSGGHNVAPAPIEARLEACPLIDRAMVVGDGRPFVAALITLDGGGVVRLLESLGRDATALDASHDLVRRALQGQIDEVNAELTDAFRIRGFAVLPRPLSPEDGELTPTLKLKRDVVLARWSETVERVYGGRERASAPRRRTDHGFTAAPADPCTHPDLFALRYEAFRDAGHLVEASFAEPRLVDPFDTRAVQFALRDDEGELAGTARFIPGTGELAVESLFDFDRLDLPPEQVGEIGRLAIAPRWRAKRAPVVALIREMLDYTESIGVPHAYAFVPARAIRGYRALGLSVWEVPTRPPSARTLDARRAMAPYFATQDPRVVFFSDPARR